MIAKLLGIFDIICVLVLLAVKILPSQVVMFFAMLLTAKGIIFAAMGDRVSILDALCGIYMGLIVYGFSNHVISVAFMLILLQKGILSLFARG